MTPAEWIVAAIVGLPITYWLIRATAEPDPEPDCFGDMPLNPQHQAEYDCPGCSHQAMCCIYTAARK